MKTLLLEKVVRVVRENPQELIGKEQMINKAIVRVVTMSHIGRKEGLLALEEACNVLDDNLFIDSLLKQIINYIVDGTDPEIVEKIMTTKFMFNKYDAVESLVYYIIVTGCLEIQSGENPRCIQEELKACIPIPFIVDNFDEIIERLVEEEIVQVTSKTYK